MGLVALWREALLAQKVLAGKTRGYRSHPQLTRFRQAEDPLGAIGRYLLDVAEEAALRGYRFDRARILTRACPGRIPVTRGQLDFELGHLRRKLWRRDRRFHAKLRGLAHPAAHPVFSVVDGGIEAWERVDPAAHPLPLTRGGEVEPQ
jgi:hypothetical protein